MKFLITAASDPAAPTKAAAPSPELFQTYMKFNEEMARAGVLVASEGLNPGKQGARVGIQDGKRVVLDGPFVESKELVGGFWVVDVKDRDEAVAWALKAPTGLGSDDLLTIHPLTEAADIPAEFVALIREVAPTFAKSFEGKKGGAR
jgi:hypothetical protein